MAQNIFHFPVAFEFRTGTVDWAPAPAHMVGWWKRDDDSVDSEYLAAAIDGSRERLKIPLGMLPSDLNDACYDAFRDSDDDEASSRIVLQLSTQPAFSVKEASLRDTMSPR